MNPRTHIKLLVVAAAALLVGAAVALADISPNPVKFGGASVKKVIVTNTGSREALYRVSVVPAGAPFTVPNARDCSHVQPGGRCILKVSYSPSGAAEDRATLRVAAAGEPVQQADLIGHPGSGGGGGGGGNGPNCTLHVARHQQLVKKAGGKTVRTPYAVSLTSSEDGTVSARAIGKTKAGKSISLDTVSSPDTAGNGVVMKMKLPRSSENRLRSELAAGRSPKMTLHGQCIGQNGTTTETAVIHFSDGKSGKGFKLPLEADANVK
jgi:hypothetical protein